MWRHFIFNILLLQLFIDGHSTKSLKGPSRLNTKALRMATGKKLARPNRPPEEMGVDGAFESDMKLTPEQMKQVDDGLSGRSRYKRKAVAEDKYLWPRNIVAYQFQQDLPQHFRSTIYAAIRHWEDLTCIRFKEYSPAVAAELGHSSRVRFYKGSGCQSSIGMVGDLQETSIGDSCNYMGSVAHEIGHVLGFYHEQSRPDRDQHVDVHMENVIPLFKINFKKYGPTQVRTDEPYDVGSVMHYGSLVYESRSTKTALETGPDETLFLCDLRAATVYYAKDNNSQTIVPKIEDMKGFMGQRDGLSFLDIKTANDLYHCADHCPGNVHCNNQGYMGPNCKCMCPWGLSGPTCDDVIHSTADCGGVITARNGKFTSPNYPNFYGDNVSCHWLILGPPGSTIKLWFNHFEVEYDADGPCGYDWVEVRAHGPHLAGSKSCGGGPSTHYEYNGNALYIRFHSDESNSDFNGFEAAYSIEGGGDTSQWSAWAPWSACSKTCGGGTRVRLRTCKVDKCAGPSMQPGVCQPQAC